MDEQRKLVHGAICTLLGGACWGFSGTCAKFLMTTYAIDPIWLVCVRELGSFWLFLLAAAIQDRGAAEHRVTAVFRDRTSVLEIVGFAFGGILLSQVAYLETIDWTNSATATVLQSMNLLLVLVYVCVRTHRGPRRREVLGMALALVGTYLLATGGKLGGLTMPAEGLAWGIACALAAALLAILPRRILARWGSFVVNGYGMLVSGLVLTAFARPWEHMPALDLAGWGWIAVIIVVGTFGAYALFLHGVSEVGSLKANLLGTIEPLSATFFSVVWLGTTFLPAELAGFAMIIAMVYLTV